MLDDVSARHVDQRKRPGSPPGGKPIYVAQLRGKLAPSTVYGLLTVITHRDSADRLKRLVLVGSTGSASAIQAAAAFYCSPEEMRALKGRFVAGGFKGFPTDYQVVIRCATQGIRLLSYEYVTHIIDTTPELSAN